MPTELHEFLGGVGVERAQAVEEKVAAFVRRERLGGVGV